MMNSFQTSTDGLNSGESKRARPERRFSTTEEITINIRTAGKANGLNVAARLTTGVEGLNEGFARVALSLGGAEPCWGPVDDGCGDSTEPLVPAIEAVVPACSERASCRCAAGAMILPKSNAPYIRSAMPTTTGPASARRQPRTGCSDCDSALTIGPARPSTGGANIASNT